MTTLAAAPAPTATDRPGPTRRWAALAVLMLPVLLVSVDNTALAFAVPALSRALEPGGTQLLWIIDAYPLALAALLVTMGALGDRLGRRRVLLVGATGFAAVSALAALAPGAGALILARAALGVFGAMLMPATLSLIRHVFTDPVERRTAVAIWASGFAAGAALGPVVGGWLLQHFWWGSIFLLAVPVLVPLLALGPWLLPESRDPDPGQVDPLGILLAAAALGGTVLAIKQAAGPDPWAGAVLPAVAGVAAGAWFVRRMLTRTRPMLDVRLFANPAFSGALAVNLVSVVTLVGYLYFLSQHLQLVEGHDPAVAGLLLVPGLAVTVVAGLVAVPVVGRWGPARTVRLGMLLAALASVLVAALGHTGSPVVLLGGFALLGAGTGLAETVSNDQVVAAVPAGQAGAASAVSETAYEVGAVLGTAVLGSLLNLAYRQGLTVPPGVAGDAAARARDTLGGAAEVAERLPPQTGEALLRSATSAFDSGATLLGAIAAVLALLTAWGAARSLRSGTDATTPSGQEGASASRPGCS